MTTVQDMGTEKVPSSPHRTWVLAPALFVICALLRFGLVDRQGLWADELFSLAMATGHSLEHPGGSADPAHGDYAEAPRPLPASAYGRYLEHDDPAAGPGRVIRAVFLSDTSPPLYYLSLHGWTRILGTSDASLRSFSAAWALACFPVLWSLAGRVGGRAARPTTCILFAFSPACVYYSTEGRMYSLVWFWTVCVMWLTLALRRRGARPGLLLAWVVASAAGLLTHYFFAFVWAAACAWLWLHPGKSSRKSLGMGVGLVVLLILPWYVRLPASLANWRVTGDWLNLRPYGFDRASALLDLPWSFLSIRGTWGIRRRYALINVAVFLALALACRRTLYRTLTSPRRRLLWFWLLGACLGPQVFDLLRGTYVVAVPRYAIAGMPAAFLLVGLGLGRLRLLPRISFLVLIVLLDCAGVRRMYLNEARNAEPTRQLGRLLADRADGADLVIVHSIPSGVAGVARYLEAGDGPGKGAGFASWVGQLGRRRVPEDLRRLSAGRRRIHLVRIHDVGEPAPQEAWLRENATTAGEDRLESATILHFTPRRGGDFFPDRPGLGDSDRENREADPGR